MKLNLNVEAIDAHLDLVLTPGPDYCQLLIDLGEEIADPLNMLHAARILSDSADTDKEKERTRKNIVAQKETLGAINYQISNIIEIIDIQKRPLDHAWLKKMGELLHELTEVQLKDFKP